MCVRSTRANMLVADEPQPNHLILSAFFRVGKSEDPVADDVDCYYGEPEVNPWLLHACSHHQPSKHPCHLECFFFTVLQEPLYDLLVISAHTTRSALSLCPFHSGPYLPTISHSQYFIVSIMLPPVIPSPSLLLSAPSPHHKTHFHVHHPSPSCFLAK